jgi:hypothetical protein
MRLTALKLLGGFFSLMAPPLIAKLCFTKADGLI